MALRKTRASSVKEKARRNLNLKLTDSLDYNVRQIAQERRVSVSEALRQLAWESIERQKPDIALYYSDCLITALQAALEYDATRHHNRPPPELRLEDERYLQELQSLVAELKRLNDLLASGSTEDTSKGATRVGKHFDKFFESYASALGKGAAGLTIAAATALLYNSGVASEYVNALWQRWQALK